MFYCTRDNSECVRKKKAIMLSKIMNNVVVTMSTALLYCKEFETDSEVPVTAENVCALM